MTQSTEVPVFLIRRDLVFKAPLVLIGVLESNSRVELHESTVVIQFGVYTATISTDTIESIEAIPWPIYRGIGIRLNFQRCIGLVGSTEGVVQLTLSEPSLSFLGVRCSTIALSMEEPERFIEAVTAILQK